MEPGLLGWELALKRQTLGAKSLPELTREICEAAAEGISRTGVEARFRPRNDIEVDGRKISGTGGFFDGDTLFFQGTVLVDMNPLEMISALKVPQAKLAKHKLDSAAQRVVTLRELLGEDTPALRDIQAAMTGAFAGRFGLQVEPGELTPVERVNAEALLSEEIGTEEFLGEVEEPPAARGDLAGACASPGGSIKTYLRLEGPAQNRIRAALITGDFFVTPPRLIFDLESCLRGVYLEDVASVVTDFFRQSDFEVLSVSPDDFIASIEDALDCQ
jgi:lipoate-protein ligase A